MDYNELASRFPFLTVALYGCGVQKTTYIGIIQNSSKSLVSVYIVELIKEKDQLLRFLKLGEEWWFQSNREIPINAFLKNDFDEFKFCLKSFNAKDFKVIKGPAISISAMMRRRVRRRQIQFIRVPR